ncbi:MAG: UDP-N-acetylmuramate--L-alanine ligase [Paludibacteraceae bacterium]|nr:UDP-N-acetylmuramate--L-alanine ligase [Paludibacteraceae bacterium]MBP5480128.1 UDP-N-acetylmuramate--L-alanine ligase [Paludibacteraceae bacterium]
MKKKSVYFLGIGGIGMSALARYFKAKGFEVAGYDRTRSTLTSELEQEGIDVHYEDGVDLIPESFRNAEKTLVVYTPAVPASMSEFSWFRDNGFEVMKRSQILGEVTRMQRAICVSGTHGKTTTSTMISHLLHNSHVECNAFLGGISKNFSRNLLLSDKSDLVVVEADEFDHSFLTLSPYMAVVTAVDADHLDIYGTVENYRKGFEDFVSLILPGGVLLMKKDLPIEPKLNKDVRLYSYSVEEGDFHAANIRIGGGEIIFDFVTPECVIRDIQLGVPVYVNIENGVAAMAMAYLNGVTEQEIRAAMKSFAGVKRRFDFHIKTKDFAFLDDYAHHPQELKSSIESVRALYPGKRICGVFQPHLYTRTRDLADDFARSLSLLDELVLLDIYPAREKPIEGVNSQMLLDKVTIKDKCLSSKQGLVDCLSHKDFDVLLMVGAGDLDLLIPEVEKKMRELRVKN